MLKSSIQYQIKAYSTKSLIDRLNEFKIDVLSIDKIGDFTYIVTIEYKYKTKFNQVFPDSIFINEKGFFVALLKFFKIPSIIFSLIVSILSFVFFNQLIFDIKIIGTSPNLTNKINNLLLENDVDKFKKIPNSNQIIELEVMIKEKYLEIETIDIYIDGTIFNVEYYLKENDVNINDSNTKYYASKSGVVKYSYVERGNLLCSNNQYVKKGDLLIDDYIFINDKSIYVGGYGKVFAFTWTIANVSSYCSNENYIDEFNRLLNEIRYNISKDFGDDEYIEKETFLENSFVDNIIRLKIHYTTVENIAKNSLN